MIDRDKPIAISYLGEDGALIPATPGLEVPKGYGLIPGYRDRVAEVIEGRAVPWWGTHYRWRKPTKIVDFVGCSPMGLVAVSTKFRQTWDSGGFNGLSFYEIDVEETGTMYLIGTLGRAELDEGGQIVALKDGKDFAYYRGELLVNGRLARSLKRNRIRIFFSPDLNYPRGE